MGGKIGLIPSGKNREKEVERKRVRKLSGLVENRQQDGVSRQVLVERSDEHTGWRGGGGGGPNDSEGNGSLYIKNTANGKTKPNTGSKLQIGNRGSALTHQNLWIRET